MTTDVPHFSRTLGNGRHIGVVAQGFLDFPLLGHEKANIRTFEAFGCMRCLSHGLGITLAFAFSNPSPRGRFYLGVVMMMMAKVIVSHVHQVQSITQRVIVVVFLRYVKIEQHNI